MLTKGLHSKRRKFIIHKIHQPLTILTEIIKPLPKICHNTGGLQLPSKNADERCIPLKFEEIADT
jgi:hypothetical protein